MKAFPSFGKTEYAFDGVKWVVDRDQGMDLRDYFAAQIAPHMDWVGTFAPAFEKQNDTLRAERVYQIADAMMKAREQK